MSLRSHVRWLPLVTIVVALGVVFAGPVAAAAKCKKVAGRFTLQALDPSACSSPVGFCVAGTYHGDLSGSARFTGSSIIQTVDTPSTGVLVATGDNLITTRHGTLMTKDAIVFETTGAGNFGEVDTILGGTGGWTDTTGTLRATGTFINGSGTGTYEGTVCTP